MFRSDSAADSQYIRRSPSGGGGAPEGALPSMIHNSPRQLSSVEKAVKRTIDVVGATLFFLFCGPIYLLVALGVLISMGRPVHYWQNRLGANGQRFRFYKFRSMVHNSDEVLVDHLSRNDMARTEWDTFQKLQQDPRITPIGQVIRKLSMDELPQFWNVLKGDMSLVGPRPCMERQKSLYGKNWGHYCAMRPGITGLWQVSGRNRLSYARRVELDAEYVSNWSLWLDIKILLKTLVTVVTGDGSR